MIQLRQIRLTRAGDSVDKPLAKDIVVGSLRELFSDIHTLISKVPESERWNLYYTRGNGPGGQHRKWISQDVIPFDIDEIRLIDDKFQPDFEPDIPAIIDAAFHVLKVDREKCVVVSTGNGVQILVQPEQKIHNEKFFADYAIAYAGIAREINEELKRRSLTGRTDLAVFCTNGLMRLPFTINRKPGKPDREVVLLNGNLEPQPFAITPPAPGLENAEPWSVEDGGALPDKTTRYAKIDEPAVEAGCEFLKTARAHPTLLSESQWYAMLSIVGRFDDPEKPHEYSRDHPSYSRSETETKTRQAIASSGPRTCANIDKLWGRCDSCVHFKRVVSPVSIKAKTFIATEEMGFHSVSKGGALVPQPNDLRLFFERENKYVVSPESEAVFVFDGKIYRRWTDTELRAFADKHFEPAVGERAIQEFKHAVTRTNLFPAGFFDETTKGFVNFQNGVYSIHQKKLLEHSPDFGFLYVLPFEYRPDDACPTFDKFLDTFTSGDKELQLVLKEFLGYAICDDNYMFQKCLILLGGGSNGKSTFFKIINLLIGAKNISNLSLEDLSSTTAKSALEGKLINLCDELPTENFTETNSFKNLFGGTTQVRKLYKDAQTIMNKAKFLFSGNTMPKSRDTSEGFLRRLTFVPLKAVFKEGVNADPRIAEKIEPELPGVFNSVMLAFEGAKARGSLSDSAAGRAIHKSYRNSIDSVRAWFEDYVVVHDDLNQSVVPVRDLFHAYSSYCEINNERIPTKDQFLKKLEPRIQGWPDRYQRRRVAGERMYVVHGITVQTDKEVSQEF